MLLTHESDARMLGAAVMGPGSSGIAAQPRLLSLGQKTVVFAHQLYPAKQSLNAGFALLLRGQLDRPALQRSLDELLTRHAVLRTAYSLETHAPSAYTYGVRGQSMRVLALSAPDLQGQEAELAHIEAAEINAPFALDKPPLVRATLVQHNPSLHTLLIVNHSVCGDGTSLYTVYRRELATLYDAYTTGGPDSPSPLPQLVEDFDDFVRWENERNSGKNLDRRLKFWQRQIEGAPSEIGLLADAPRPAVPTGRGGHISGPTIAGLLDRVDAFGRKHAGSRVSVLLSVFYALLLRHSGQVDRVISVPVSRRPPKFAGVFGRMVNPLPIRAVVAPEHSFVDLLEQVEATTFRAFMKMDLAFEKLVEATAARPDSDVSHLNRIVFNFTDYDAKPIGLRGLATESRRLTPAATYLELVAEAEETSEGFRLSFLYNEDVYAAESMQCMLDQYYRLLDEALEYPHLPLSQLSLLGVEERRLTRWCRAAESGVAIDRTDFLSLFSGHVAAHPNRIACSLHGAQLTYEQLDRRARALAAAVLRRGSPGERDLRIGLAAGSGLERSVGCLGILMAGAICVPLTVESDRAALDCAREGYGLDAVVTLPCVPMDFGPGDPLVFVDLVAETREGQARPSRLPDRRAIDAVLLLDIGDGSVSGAAAGHGSSVRGDVVESELDGSMSCCPIDPEIRVRYTVGDVANLLEDLGSQLALGSGTRVSSRAASAVEDILFNVLLPLSIGGVSVTSGVATADLAGSLAPDPPKELSTSTSSSRSSSSSSSTAAAATCFCATARAFQDLLVSGWTPASGLVALVTNGAPLPGLSDRLLGAGAKLHVIHENRWLGAYAIGEVFRAGGVRPLLKRLLRGFRVTIVDPWGAEVPFGHIGRLQVARCDAAPLLPLLDDGTPKCPTTSVVTTGALGRYAPGGWIECLGSYEDWAKLEGYWMDLKQVGEALAGLLGVQDLIVRLVADTDRGESLCAYYVAASDLAPDQLREQFASECHRHEIPQYFVRLDALPRDAAGLVDNDALPVPDSASWQEAGLSAVPRSDTEVLVAGLWKQVLGAPVVGIDDNFFDLGGHSMLALLLTKRLEAALHCEFDVGTLFANPTVRALCGALGRNGAATLQPDVIPLQTAGAGAPLFCICGIHVYQDLAQLLGGDRPVYGVYVPVETELLGGGSRPQPAAIDASTIPRLAAHYVAAIRKVQPHGPYSLAGVCFGGVLAYEVACQLEGDNEEIGLLLLMEAVLAKGRTRVLGAWVRAHLSRLIKSGPRYLLERARSWTRAVVASRRGLATGQGWSVPSRKVFAGSDPVTHSEEQELELARELEAGRNERYKTAMSAYEGRILLHPGITLLVYADDEPTFEGYRIDALGGFGPLIQGRKEVRRVRGDHLGILKRPNVEELVRMAKGAFAEIDNDATQAAGRGRLAPSDTGRYPPSSP
ncbi:MAG: condensation domain-containing protein [Nannocystaceae bacterium]